MFTLADLLALSPIVLALLALPFVHLAVRRVRGAELGKWVAVAERLGLRNVETFAPQFGEPRLEGWVGPRRIRIDRTSRSEDRSVLRVVVEGSSGVTLRPEAPANALAKRLRKREIELGDEAFDAAVEIHGAPERVRALLDVETRGLALRTLGGILSPPGARPVTVRGSVALVDGDLTVELPERPPRLSLDELYELVAALLALAQRFHLPADVAARLAATVEREPLWRVRLHGLQLLSTGYPSHPATGAALRRALTDERTEIRLHAAIALGEEARSTLLELATDESVADAVSAHAVHTLGDSLPAGVAATVLRQALRLRRVQTADACIHALGREGGAEASGLLAKVLAVETGALAVAAAEALGKAGGPEAEATLLAALERDLAVLTVPVIAALGHVGSARAVPPIQEVAAGPGADSEVRRAARQAVAEIQSRLHGASPGQVSIADGGVGHLSLPEADPRGRVSLPAGP